MDKKASDQMKSDTGQQQRNSETAQIRKGFEKISFADKTPNQQSAGQD